MKKRHKAEEIIRILRDIERGGTVVDGVKRHGITEQTYYRWKKKYGGMEVDEAKRLKAVAKENGQLKRIVAEQTLIIDGLKELQKGNW